MRGPCSLGPCSCPRPWCGQRRSCCRREIRVRAPDFAPRTLLDFGSGLGTACWVAQGMWGRSLQQFVCVEPSGAMRELAERLRHGGGATPGPAHFGPVFLRPLLPPGPQARWELVIGRRALERLRGRGQRARALRGLWGRTGGVLVLLENGTRAGHQALMEAREELLQGPDADAVEIFAPCPHRLPCPRLSQGRACAFAQSFWPLPLSGNPSAPERELVSFLVVRRLGSSMTSSLDPVTSSPDPVTSSPDPMTSPPAGWARVTAPVRPRPRHVSLSLCCPDGAQRRLAVTAVRHGRSLYRQARTSRWGDLLPFPGEGVAANGRGEGR
ncbi:H/ACA ribonucleoprotein complex subunit 3 isoform X1 [Cygnus olor]|uniref:H/ACA ribonucleoprotein complex subunit 3 isoform X1 n=2 Tax=Cygnus olor TaxID=8869 RepID=UPI001ADE7B42|nr:H/ACA ribonucleoprotein complex subunit 3 isoform X1 [Cygnus olor]